ncbi:hypothetical protein E3N88_43595 [Mikania micrantha]|uniref:Uncharacterized protein n=1 Tax=Mikania micrantha TaxID=192012 RepID=A0A5N6LEG7_9ASTR|nr:hypothetical protein E3N88_43595 [Mikania micrantha]
MDEENPKNEKETSQKKTEKPNDQSDQNKSIYRLGFQILKNLTHNARLNSGNYYSRIKSQRSNTTYLYEEEDKDLNKYTNLRSSLKEHKRRHDDRVDKISSETSEEKSAEKM